jgi:signal recognition particle receptor subunit beta
MVFFNWATMQMAAKIVYYGPGLCGKTSNLSYIYAKTTPNSRGEMVSLETESDRTLFFDLLPIEVGTIGGFKTRLQLYTVPGQVFYNTTRKLVLKGVDGLVFVADSQRPMREANIESFTSLVDNLKDLGLEMADLPLVLQYNKRDLKNILTIDELNSDLNPHAIYSFHEASAINGDGVFETLKEITKLTLKKLRKRMASSQPGGRVAGAGPVRPAMPSQRSETISAAALARAAEEGVVSEAAPAQAPERAVPTSAVAPPMPARPASQGNSDVFPTPEPPPDASRSEEAVEEEIEFPSMEVTAPELQLEIDPDPQVALEIDDGSIGGEQETGDEWHDRRTEAPEPGETEEAFSPADPAENIAFAQQASAETAVEPPPMKRVHVSNQLDILAELEGLRAGALSGSPQQSSRSSVREIDIDSLISGAVGEHRELRRRVDARIDPAVFRQIRGVEVSITVNDENGDVIHTIPPAVVEVDATKDLKKLTLRLGIDLENDA